MSEDTPKPNRRRRRRALGCLGVVGVLLAAGVALPSCVHGPTNVALEIRSFDVPAPPARQPGAPLRVMSLNLAHGRADGMHQLLTSNDTFRRNLELAAALIRREAPDFVAFQEADGPSFWSGRFDHVEHLTQHAGYARYVRAENVQGVGLAYGTALMSQLPLLDPIAHTFEPTWPTFPKGFVVATVAWPGRPDVLVDVVSVHMDFARGDARVGQAKEIIRVLEGREHPRILLGDFNCEWNDEEPTLRILMESLELSTWRPEAKDLVTFPLTGERLDWILISPEIRFVRQEVLTDVVSDHRGLVAELELR